MIKNLAGVQDVFCGPETIIHMQPGKTDLAEEALKDAFAEFEIVFEGLERDDSVLL